MNFSKLKSPIKKITDSKLAGSSVNTLIISFVFAGVFIGILIIAQFKSEVTANSFLLDEINAQKDLLKSFDQDRIVLKTKLNSLREQVAANQLQLENSSQGTDLKTLNQLKEKVGLTSVKGEGLEITLNDGQANDGKDNADLVHAADLRDIVNLLRTAQAKAISINGQRVIAQTSINSVGNTILVNKAHIITPFKINVIGDTELILSRINDEKAYPDLYKRINSKKIFFVLKKLKDITVPNYDGEISVNSLKKYE